MSVEPYPPSYNKYKYNIVWLPSFESWKATVLFRGEAYESEYYRIT